jgi:hypothetical protein
MLGYCTALSRNKGRYENKQKRGKHLGQKQRQVQRREDTIMK